MFSKFGAPILCGSKDLSVTQCYHCWKAEDQRRLLLRHSTTTSIQAAAKVTPDFNTLGGKSCYIS